MFEGEGPLFAQLAMRIADDIVAGTYPEGSAIPSISDFATFFRTSPMTAAKGVNLLVEQGALEKRRGIGMFVTPGAQQLLRGRRNEGFRQQFIAPLVREARLLGIDTATLHDLIDQEDRP